MECNRGRRVDQNFDFDDENWDHNWNIVDVIADEILQAIVPERDKECDVTAKRADTKENNMVDVGPWYASSAGGSIQTLLLVV